MPHYLRNALLIFSAGVAGAAPPSPVRFATYNVSFFRATEGALLAELSATPASVTGPSTRRAPSSVSAVSIGFWPPSMA